MALCMTQGFDNKGCPTNVGNRLSKILTEAYIYVKHLDINDQYKLMIGKYLKDIENLFKEDHQNKGGSNMKNLLVALLIGTLLLMSCANLPRQPSVCDTIQAPSRLCALASKYNVRLEDIGNGLIIANAVAISQGLYTKQDALDVLKSLRLILDNPLSYAAFKLQVYEKVDEYPGLLEVASIYFSELGNMTQIMYTADQDMLKKWLNARIEALK